MVIQYFKLNFPNSVGLIFSFYLKQSLMNKTIHFISNVVICKKL